MNTWKIPRRNHYGIPAVIPEEMPFGTLVSSRFSKPIAAEIPKRILGGFPKGILGCIFGRILRGNLAGSSTRITERITEEIPV